jgi:conjugal transfer pilus assembly protein TrbC
MKQAWIAVFLLSLLMVMSRTNASDRVAVRSSSPTVYVFVSFSMPHQSLEAILHDAKKIHASVVIRGLINNSFQSTMLRIAELVKTSGGDGMVLNPLWFKRFNIQSVPSVVVVPKGSMCFTKDTCDQDSDYDRITGDIPITAALKMIRDKGHVTQSIAESALNQLQDTSHG